MHCIIFGDKRLLQIFILMGNVRGTETPGTFACECLPKRYKEKNTDD